MGTLKSWNHLDLAASFGAVLFCLSAAHPVQATVLYTQSVYCNDSALLNACTLPLPSANPASASISGLQPNSTFFESCCQVLSDNLPPMEQMVANAGMDYYLGKVRDPNSSTTPPTYIPGMNYPVPTCNLANGTVPDHPWPGPSSSPVPDPSPTPEIGANLVGGSCGSGVCQFGCQLVSDSGLVQCQVSSSCSRELAWTRGVFMQLLWSKLAEVENEMNTRTLNLSSQCTPAVSGAAAAFAKLQTTLLAWNNYWLSAGQTPPQISSTCADNDPLASVLNPSSPSASPASSEPYIAANLLCAARKQIEAFPFRIAACEALARTESTWLSNPPNFVTTLGSVVTGNLNSAFPGCVNRYVVERKRVAVMNDNVGFSNCMSAAYASSIQKKFQQQAAALAASPAAVPSPVPSTASVPSSNLTVNLSLTTQPLLSCTAGVAAANPYEPVICDTSGGLSAPFDITMLGILSNAGDGLDQVSSPNATATPGNLDMAIDLLSTETAYSPD